MVNALSFGVEAKCLSSTGFKAKVLASPAWPR